MIVDRVIFVLILVLAGVYFWATQQIPSLEIGDPLGPKAFPRLLGVALLITAALLAGEMWKARKEKPPPAEAGTEVDHVVLASRGGYAGPLSRALAGAKAEYLVVAGVTVWTGLYFVLFEPLGFIIATTIYLLGLTIYFNRGKWIANVSTSILFPVVSYLLFTKGLGVNLARGVLPF
jgi:putative tricarboxylic transport membrane protein